MSAVTNAHFFRQAVACIKAGVAFGWHELNAGNISLLLTEDEVGEVSAEFAQGEQSVRLEAAVPSLAGRYVFTTVAGSCFLNADICPEKLFCICLIGQDGAAVYKVWGDGAPTSELTAHLLSLAVLDERGEGRAVYHCHPESVIALSALLPLDDAAFTKVLWQSAAEYSFMFPSGIGVIGFAVPGSVRLAKFTARKLKRCDVVVWAFHGLFSAGGDMLSAFGRAQAADKAFRVRMMILAAGKKPLNSMAPAEISEAAKSRGKKLNKAFLDTLEY